MRVLKIDSTHSILDAKLKAAGFEIDDAINSSKEEILKIINYYSGIIIRSRINIDKEFIDEAVNLKFVARVGSGMESIDSDYCDTKKIVCLNSPEGNRDSVGEHCIGMLLSLLHKLNIADREVRQGLWLREKNRGTELKGKTVGIIGYGNTGRSVATKLLGFGCKVIAYDKYKKGFSDNFVSEVEMDEIYAKSDILSLHIPLTLETNYLVNSEFIDRFKKNFMLLNAARGPIVNTNHLVDALQRKKIIAAGLDVIEYEETSFETTIELNTKQDFQFLAAAENVILSPHIGGWTHESKIRLAEVLADKIIDLVIKSN